jgi:hypothetical protein
MLLLMATAYFVDQGPQYLKFPIGQKAFLRLKKSEHF